MSFTKGGGGGRMMLKPGGGGAGGPGFLSFKKSKKYFHVKYEYFGEDLLMEALLL